jgi:hypothetical protein
MVRQRRLGWQIGTNAWMFPLVRQAAARRQQFEPPGDPDSDSTRRRITVACQDRSWTDLRNRLAGQEENMSVDVKYRTTETAGGGRDGIARAEDGTFEVRLATPKTV